MGGLKQKIMAGRKLREAPIKTCLVNIKKLHQRMGKEGGVTPLDFLTAAQRHAWLPSGHGTRNTDLTNYSRASAFAPRSPRLPSMADSTATENKSSLVEPTLEFRARNFWPTAAGNFSPGDWRK